MHEWIDDLPIKTGPIVWRHTHVDDGEMHQHAVDETCDRGRTFPFFGQPDDMTNCVWAYTKKGALRSISKEVTAAILATEFPDTIYFVAAMVTHPDYEK